MSRYKTSDRPQYYECEWCHASNNWRGHWRGSPYRRRECQRFRLFVRDWCERVLMPEKAAERNKKTPLKKASKTRRAMRAAAAKAKEEVKNRRRTNSLVSDFDELSQFDGRMPAEVYREMGAWLEMETEAGTEKDGVSPKSKHHYGLGDATTAQQRQAKSCTGPKSTIDEGVSLASDDDDFARIHAANRKAWPRGQQPIAADATAEDREIAELVRRGFIGAEHLQVDHDGFGEGECLYTVRFVEARKKGRKGNNHRRHGVQVAEPTLWDAESDWWYLDDEAYARLLSDGGTEFLDWSEASSFVHVD
jgi:hypothetical protein